MWWNATYRLGRNEKISWKMDNLTKRINKFEKDKRTLLFFIERVVGYYVGYIDNEFQEYPIPVLIWTLVFGMVMGGIYVLLSPIYEDMKQWYLDKRNV